MSATSIGVATGVTHPLDPATGEEFLAGREILAGAGLLGEHVRFAYYGLEEPAKAEVLAFQTGDEPRRALRAMLIDVATGESSDVVVSLTEGAVVSRRVLDHELRRRVADPDAGLRAGRGDRARRRGLAGRDGPARPDRRQQAPRVPADRRPLRLRGRGRPAHGARADLRAGGRRRPGLGPPGRRDRGLRRPDRGRRLPAGRRAGPAGAGDVGQLRRPRGPRPAARGAQADRDHPAGWSELQRRRQPDQLAELVGAGRVRRPRGHDAAPDHLRRPRARAADRLPRLGARDGGAVRRSRADALLAELLRRRGVPRRPAGQLPRAGLRLPRRDPLPGRDGHR